jgi:hypothetical protein
MKKDDNMNVFQQTKKAKMDRMPLLRIFTLLGIITWVEGRGQEAKQKIRLINPLSWVWILAVFLYRIVASGVPSAIRDIKTCFEEESVWF